MRYERKLSPDILIFCDLFNISHSKQPDGDTLWTLVLTNPDGHFTENDKEYVHWFV